MTEQDAAQVSLRDDPIGVVGEFQTWLVRLRCKAKIQQVGNEGLEDLRAALAAASADPKEALAFGQAFVAIYQEMRAEIADELTVTKDRIVGILNESFDTPWSTFHEAFDVREPTTPAGKMLALIDDDHERGLLDRLSLKVRRRAFEKPAADGAFELVEEVEALAISVARRLANGARPKRVDIEAVPEGLRVGFNEAVAGVPGVVVGIDLPPCDAPKVRRWLRENAELLGVAEEAGPQKGKTPKPAHMRPLVRGLLTLHRRRRNDRK